MSFFMIASLTVCGDGGRVCQDQPWSVSDESPPFERVVLVTIDTLRADHVGHNGYFRDTTPFIDSLAARGVAYHRAISTVSHTLPSHGSILTGLLPTEHGALTNAMDLDPSMPNLVCMFSEHGMQTAASTSVKFLGGLNIGFDIFETPQGEQKFRSATQTVDAALDWFRQEDTGSFFLWVHLFDVHEWKDGIDSELHAFHAESIRQGTDVATAVAMTEKKYGLPLSGGPKATDSTLPQGDPKATDAAATRATLMSGIDSYDARLRYADSEVRRLFETIEGRDMSGATLWVIAADHGEGLGQRGYEGHGKHIYQEQLHVPLVLYSSKPGFPDKDVDGLVSTADLAWTLREWWHQPGIPADGRAALPGLFENPRPDPERVVFSERRPPDEARIKWGWFDERVVSIQMSHLKYIAHGQSSDEAFNLDQDPNELDNLLLRPDANGTFAPLLSRAQSVFGKLGVKAEIVETPSDEILEELRELGYIQ